MGDSIVLVVPCYDEEESLASFYEEVCRVRTRMDTPVSLLFVNDGSQDSTLDILRGFAADDPLCHFISFSRNFGKEAAIYAGLCRAAEDDARYAALIDADLQDPPALLEEMFATLEATGCDSVAAYRLTRHGESPLHAFLAHTFYRAMNRLSEVRVIDGARDYRIMTNQMLHAVISLSERTRFSKGIFEWVGFDTRWVGFESAERRGGRTKWSTKSLFAYAIEGIVSFSTVPLETVSVVGLAMFAVSLVFLLFIFFRALFFGDPVKGWPSAICIVSLVSGLQLLCLGILGLYLAKTYTEAKGRPLYLIKEEA